MITPLVFFSRIFKHLYISSILGRKLEFFVFFKKILIENAILVIGNAVLHNLRKKNLIAQYFEFNNNI